MINRVISALCVSTLALMVTAPRPVHAAEDLWVIYEGGEGPGKGKHIVLISGDEEYRSEEALPALGKILSKHHGFKCTVVFPIDPADGTISPNVNNNIPGLEALKTADLMIIATRFRNLPDDQMKHIVDYIEAGKPIIGMRTATHAFNIPDNGTYVKYSWGFGGKDYEKGFGRQILGETWVSHWGGHGSQSTRGILAEGAKDHPILKGLKDGDIWGPTDVYEAHPIEGSTPLVLGQVVDGMKFDDKPLEDPAKNNPMMPVSWVRTYKGKDGKEGRVFTTTMGAATDLVAEGSRRMMINAAYWALGLEDKIDPKACVDTVGEFKPTNFGFNGAVKGVKPAEHKM